MDVYEALYTTRAMRRLARPHPADVQAKILDAAIRAPTGGTARTGASCSSTTRLIGQLGEIYRVHRQLWVTFYKERLATANANPDAESIADLKMQRSAQRLADHFADVPLLLFGFAEGDGTGGSIFPAIWSAQLAARAEGVGTSLTQAMVFELPEVLKLLGVRRTRLEHVVLVSSDTRPGSGRRRPPACSRGRLPNPWDGPLGFEVPNR